MLKLFALLMTIDGALTAVLGRRYLRWLHNHLPWPISPLAGWFMTWPGLLLRGGAALQALFGWSLFWRLSGAHWWDDERWHVPSTPEERPVTWH
ncbi:MAG: hypothetical protein EHM39_11565 [Chloroflexi bacterium]|nr:MAG: hypothetical protein EHM39_11565 [Chloroflexota bacterium]